MTIWFLNLELLATGFLALQGRYPYPIHRRIGWRIPHHPGLWKQRHDPRERRKKATADGLVAIEALRDNDSGVQNVAAGAIRRMGGLALKPLIALLKEKDVKVRLKAANLLAQIKNPLAVERLNAALADEDLVIVAGACTYFTKSSQKAAEDALIQGLDAYNTKEMIRNFLNCGNVRLREAACKWAAMHGDEQLCISRCDALLGNGK